LGFGKPSLKGLFGIMATEADTCMQFILPDILQLPPISQHGNMNEIAGKFGGLKALRTAVEQIANAALCGLNNGPQHN